MKTLVRNLIAITCFTTLLTACDSGSKPATQQPPNLPRTDSTTPSATSVQLPPGETGNRTTNAFRDTVINMDTDLNFLRLQGEWVFATPFNKHDGLGGCPRTQSI